MAGRGVILALGVISCLLLAASAAESAPFFPDYLANIKSAKPATYKPADYYEETQTLCLKDTKWEKCAWFGCFECDPTDVAVRSDFTCCGHDEDRYDHSFAFTQDNSVGYCDWKFNAFSTGPIDQGDGIYKIGEASAVCRMGHEADKCGGAACDKMVIGVQAGVFWAPAYSNYPPNTINVGSDTNSITDPDPSCCILDYMGFAYIPGCEGKKAPVPGSWNGKTSKHPALIPNRKKKPSADNKVAKTAEIGGETIYGGYAMIISGPMYVSTPHGAPQEVEETGMFEYVPQVDMEPITTAPVEPAYWVKPGSYKLKFTSEDRKY